MHAREAKIQSELIEVSQSGPRKLAQFAVWIINNFDEVAFLSIRGITDAAGLDTNLAPRLAHTLGYDSYNDFRAEVRRIVQTRGESYGKRARLLKGRDSYGVYTELTETSQQNFETVTSPINIAQIDSCVDILLKARRIHTVGVRSCFSVAHYLSYVGSGAFDNFVKIPSMPGDILDQISQVSPDDVLIAITYEHYSAEVVQACHIAQTRDAKIIALTDSLSSPLAFVATKSIILPMSGPQLMPSLVSAFLTVEMILAAMASRSEGAANRIADFEKRIAKFGGYLGAAPR